MSYSEHWQELIPHDAFVGEPDSQMANEDDDDDEVNLTEDEDASEDEGLEVGETQHQDFAESSQVLAPVEESQVLEPFEESQQVLDPFEESQAVAPLEDSKSDATPSDDGMDSKTMECPPASPMIPVEKTVIEISDTPVKTGDVSETLMDAMVTALKNRSEIEDRIKEVNFNLSNAKKLLTARFLENNHKIIQNQKIIPYLVWQNV